ncbi:hypothetical protein [Paraburkholderia susongensis]|uniref:Uncharacterized protein n=1 Tax=Paraburkholderia susongensis TaxID=1515439 RepID=A0A1X7I6C0_9BURK|nr:hypothetical protein [Paraburkholderia susongensis]SMG09817.1 hypothetical protein SAMN06265784_101348 [Paraburkholderia susongensis]
MTTSATLSPALKDLIALFAGADRPMMFDGICEALGKFDPDEVNDKLQMLLRADIVKYAQPLSASEGGFWLNGAKHVDLTGYDGYDVTLADVSDAIEQAPAFPQCDQLKDLIATLHEQVRAVGRHAEATLRLIELVTTLTRRGETQ